MPITDKQKRQLKKLAHHLKPVVMLGQHGLTANIHHEIAIALDHHELIKVRVNAADREERKALIEEIARHSGADLVLTVGHVAVFFRRNPDKPRIDLAN